MDIEDSTIASMKVRIKHEKTSTYSSDEGGGGGGGDGSESDYYSSSDDDGDYEKLLQHQKHSKDIDFSSSDNDNDDNDDNEKEEEEKVASVASVASPPPAKKKTPAEASASASTSSGKRKKNAETRTKAASVSKKVTAPQKTSLHKPTGSSRSRRAGLLINIGRVATCMRAKGASKRQAKHAPVAMAAVLQYAISQMCLAANDHRLASSTHPVRTGDFHVSDAIKNDPELHRLIGKDVCIMNSRVTEYLDPNILKSSSSSRKRKKRNTGVKMEIDADA